MQTFLEELNRLLPTSDSVLRKTWARRIVDENVSLPSLMQLLHGNEKTAQRFMWLISDLLDVDTSIVAPVLPMLFDLRDKMPFPGMRRIVAKCLWVVDLSDDLQNEAIPVLFRWLEHDEFEIGVKHYAAKALYDLAVEQRINTTKLAQILQTQCHHENQAHAGRMRKLRDRLQQM